jgi:hypothetical protein
LQNATVTSSALHAFDAIFPSICKAELPVISSSFSVNHPDSLGHVVTLSCDSGGSWSLGMRKWGGIFSASASRFAAAIFSQSCSAMLQYMYMKVSKTTGSSRVWEEIQNSLRKYNHPLPRPVLPTLALSLPRFAATGSTDDATSPHSAWWTKLNPH